MAESFNVEVAFATPENQRVIPLTVPVGYTAAETVKLSNISSLFQELAEIDDSNIQLGIFGQIISANHVLEEGDRVEIYRPLIIDPKESRRQRAQQAKNHRNKR